MILLYHAETGVSDCVWFEAVDEEGWIADGLGARRSGGRAGAKHCAFGLCEAARYAEVRAVLRGESENALCHYRLRDEQDSLGKVAGQGFTAAGSCARLGVAFEPDREFGFGFDFGWFLKDTGHTRMCLCCDVARKVAIQEGVNDRFPACASPVIGAARCAKSGKDGVRVDLQRRVEQEPRYGADGSPFVEADPVEGLADFPKEPQEQNSVATIKHAQLSPT